MRRMLFSVFTARSSMVYPDYHLRVAGGWHRYERCSQSVPFPPAQFRAQKVAAECATELLAPANQLTIEFTVTPPRSELLSLSQHIQHHILPCPPSLCLRIRPRIGCGAIGEGASPRLVHGEGRKSTNVRLSILHALAVICALRKCFICAGLIGAANGPPVHFAP